MLSLIGIMFNGLYAAFGQCLSFLVSTLLSEFETRFNLFFICNHIYIVDSARLFSTPQQKKGLNRGEIDFATDRTWY